MALNYDQRSSMRMAFEEAHVPADRRGSQRIRMQCPAKFAPWSSGRAGKAFDVIIDDFSTSGAGIIHTGRLKVGARYLLTIPRSRQTPLDVILTVVRCEKTVDGLFTAELSPDEILGVASGNEFGQPASRPNHLRAALLIAALLVSLAVLTQMV